MGFSGERFLKKNLGFNVFFCYIIENKLGWTFYLIALCTSAVLFVLVLEPEVDFALDTLSVLTAQ